MKVNEKTKKVPQVAPGKPDKFKKGISCGDGTIKIKKRNTLLHSFLFLKMVSGMEVITSMIQRQNHFT